MLSGVKFIPREQVDKAEDENTDRLVDKKKNSSSSKTNKHRRQKKSSGYGSSDDDELERIEKRSRRKKKWYSSEESSSGSSSGSEDEGSSDKKRKKRKNRGKSRRKSHDSLEDEDDRVKEKLKRGKKKKMKNYLSDEYSSSSSEDEKGNRSEKGGRYKGKAKSCEKQPRYSFSDDENQSGSLKDMEIVRKEMGLDWMLRPADRPGNKLSAVDDNQPDEPPSEEIKVNPRELNPYLKDNGTGYPDEGDLKRSDGDRLQSSSIVGDGGASWRLKALKRAQEQASREGRNLEEVVGERWGSLGQLTVSVASHRAAPYRAHLHAIRGRKRGLTDEDGQTESDAKKNSGRDYLKDVSARHPEMRAPKINDSLSWGKRKSQNTSSRDAGVISAAASSMNKFVDDGSFLSQFVSQQSNDSDTIQKAKEKDLVLSKEDKHSSDVAVANEALSANQLAAKALQLRLKGQHEVAEKLMQEAQNVRTKQSDTETLSRQEVARSVSRHVISQHASARRKEEDDSDRHLAKQIMQNKQYSLSGRADDEYDFEDGPRKKSKKKNIDDDRKVSGINNVAKRILTQQERCLFCFENPNRPKHLVVSIANTTYLMLPQWEAVVPGHCCIVTMQHEASTRTVDDNVWEEIRNFKKCLIMMFAKQEKEVVFLETVMRLAQQRRHSLIECIPLPQEVAKQAPLYFKKAIDEAEEEWSQHNAKKLIDTSVKGLRGSIPKGFPYFHVEFGLNRGFVHVIDDEEQFKSSLGLNVIRGMLQLPEEDMFRRRRHKSFEVQKQAVASFARDWEPFDWTKQLD